MRIKEAALFEAALYGHAEVVKSICIMSFGMNAELKQDAMGPALFGEPHHCADTLSSTP